MKTGFSCSFGLFHRGRCLRTAGSVRRIKVSAAPSVRPSSRLATTAAALFSGLEYSSPLLSSPIYLNHPEMPSNQNIQGGKAFGLLKAQQREKLEEINKEYLEDQKYSDEEDLAEKLDSFKNKYAEFDLNDQGEIDMMALKRMMEKLGVPKTHLEMKKMISEVTGGSSDTINYRDFVKMMLGKRSAVLKLVMMFEDKANGASCKPDGPPPKRDIASLP